MNPVGIKESPVDSFLSNEGLASNIESDIDALLMED